MDRDFNRLKEELETNIKNVKSSLNLLEKIFEYQAKEILDRDYKWSL